MADMCRFQRKCNLFLVTAHMISFIASSMFLVSNSLSLELIHWDSPESPFYPGNITQAEKFHVLVQKSTSYVNRMFTMSKIIGKVNIRPQTAYLYTTPILMVRVELGTFPSHLSYSYFLGVSLDFNMLWLQCEECKTFKKKEECFPQQEPLFPNSRSSTYKPLQCDKHLLCHPKRCLNNICAYYDETGNGFSSLGYLASETFRFPSNRNNTEKVNLVFGCGIANKGPSTSHIEPYVGMLGMNEDKGSFLMQIKDRSKSRFSYCISPPNQQSRGLLRFGDDIPPRPHFKSTKLLVPPQFKSNVHYRIILKGISISNNRWLPIRRSIFEINRNGSGGVIIDTNATFTTLVIKAYNILRKSIEAFVSRIPTYKRFHLQGSNATYLCYTGKSTKDFPSLTLHSENADLTIHQDFVFYEYSTFENETSVFCMAILPHKDRTKLGTDQQVNKRFIFDLPNRKLYFGAEDCSKSM